MAKPTCIIEGCDRDTLARGYCSKHYHALRKSGDLIVTPRSFAHAITNADIDARLGDCLACGPRVKIRVRYRRQSGEPTVTCRKSEYGTAPRRRRPPKGRNRSGWGYEWKWGNYGITDEEFRVRLAAQQGRCLICGESLDRPMIDHDHETGHVRGLLCGYCNSGLGFFRDNPKALARAAKYVRRYSG